MTLKWLAATEQTSYQWIDFVWQDLVKGVAVVSQSDATVGGNVGNVDVLVDVDNEFSFGMNLDQNLLLVHHLDNLANVGALLSLQLWKHYFFEIFITNFGE